MAEKESTMNAQTRKTISRTFTFILLIAASFWLFACQANAAVPGGSDGG